MVANKPSAPMIGQGNDDGPATAHFLAGRHGRRNTAILVAAAILAAVAVSSYVNLSIVVPACRFYGHAQGLAYAGTKTWDYRHEEGIVCVFQRADGSEMEIPLQRFTPFLKSLALDWILDLRLGIPSFIALFTLLWLGMQRVAGR